MDRALFVFQAQLGLLDCLREAGGTDLVGFYVTLASYVDGHAGDGRLIFNTTTGAITTLKMSRERYYKLKGQLEALGLYKAEDGRIYLLGEATVRTANTAVRNSDRIVRIPNAAMSLSQEEEGDYYANFGDDARASEEEPDPLTQAIVAEGQARQFAHPSPPQIAELAAAIDHLDPDLVVYGIEIMDGYGNRAWGPVLNQCRRWAENGIRTRQEALEDHRNRREMLDAHRQDRRNQAPMTAPEFRALVQGRMAAGRTTVAKEITLLRWTKPATFAPSLTVKGCEEIIRQVAKEICLGA